MKRIYKAFKLYLPLLKNISLVIQFLFESMFKTK